MSEPRKSFEPGWTENQKWGSDRIEETPGSRMISYTALVVLCALLAGGALAAFPYAMAVWTAGRSRPAYSHTDRAAEAEWWLQGETGMRALWRFAAGATAGAAGIGIYLIRQRYKDDQRSVGKDPDDGGL